eukprot:14507866-Heterocapsa_arctica.AAC.1
MRVPLLLAGRSSRKHHLHVAERSRGRTYSTKTHRPPPDGLSHLGSCQKPGSQTLGKQGPRRRLGR